MKQQFRIGTGFDIHQLTTGRKLILGGVEIPFEKGLEGHSDADALLHAICDAILGALAKGDIGHFFPDTDINYKDADSIVFLKAVNETMLKEGYEISNIDSMIALQRPKIFPYIEEMKKIIARTLYIDIDQVSIKATTSEKLGFIGREEGIFCSASVLLIKK